MRLLLVLAATLSGFAPNLNPIAWTLRVEPGKLVVHASIAENYKLFSPSKKTPGPIPLQIRVLENRWLRAGKLEPLADTDMLTGEVDLIIPYRLRRAVPEGGVAVQVEVKFQSCSDIICLPPKTRVLEAKLLAANAVL